MAVDPRAFNQDVAGLVTLQAIDAAQDRRLAGAGRPDDADHFALLDRSGDALQHLVRTKSLVNVAKLDHLRFALFSKWRTSRISGMLMVRYISATSVNTLVFLKVEDAISLPCSASSATVIVEAWEESFSSMIMTLP